MTEVWTVYKICAAQAWETALAVGHFAGSADDLRDGFIHLSTAAQLPGTVVKHFSGQADLVLVAIDVTQLGASLIWEPSRGGALFPHLYVPLDVRAALAVRPLQFNEAGVPILPEDINRC